jgi:aromatic ring hydroxylase
LQPVQALQLQELPREVHKKGDHQGNFDARPLLAPALAGHDIGLVSEAGMPAVAEQLGMLAAKSAMVESMMWGMEAAGYMWGDYYMPNKHMMYTAQVITQDLYPQFINTIRNMDCGSMIMMPS